MKIPALFRQVWARHQEAHRLMNTPLSVLLNERAPSVWGPALTSTDPVSGITDEVSKGADINERDDRGRTVLHQWAYNPSIAQGLLALGANADAPDHDGVTPLMVACEEGVLASVDVFLAAGASPHTIAWPRLAGLDFPDEPTFQRSDITTPVLMALSLCPLWDEPRDLARFQALETMVRGPDGHDVPAFVLEPWYLPGTHLDHPVYEHLATRLRSGLLRACTPLSLSIGFPAIALRLLDAGADPHLCFDPRPTHASSTLLHATSSVSSDSDVDASQAVALLQRLLDHGFSPRAVDHDGLHPWQLHDHPACRGLLFRAYEADLLRQSLPEDAVASEARLRRRL